VDEALARVQTLKPVDIRDLDGPSFATTATRNLFRVYQIVDS
jgi:hypothetical protein